MDSKGQKGDFMPGEGNPTNHAEHTGWLPRGMVWLTRMALRFPLASLSLALGIAAASLVLTGVSLGYKSSRLDLLNPHSDYNRLWLEYIDEFGDDDDAVIVVEGSSQEQVVAVLQEISKQLAQETHFFHSVLHQLDLSKIRAKGLHYLSADELRAVEQFVGESSDVVRGNWSRLKISHTLGEMIVRLQALSTPPADQPPGTHPVSALPPGPQRQLLAQSVLGQLSRYLESLSISVREQGRTYHSPWPGMPASFSMLGDAGSEYLLTNQGKLGFVLLRLATGKDKLNPRGEATDALRRLIASVKARHPETMIGLTGLPIMENDEMRSSQSSMLSASLVSLVGVALIVIAGFGGLRHALLANLVLLVGMAWSFGYVTLAVGHLNILSVTFTATLIGIGIDFGTYYVARYVQLRKERLDCQSALLETTRAVGPSISTGAVTTAIAFFAAGMTSFTGVSELGIIAGGGILLCALAQLFVLPVCVYLVDRGQRGGRMPEPFPVHRFIAPFMRVPRLVLLAGLGFSAFSAWGLGSLWYDHNLLNMQPVGLESVELERKLLAESDQSVWYAISIANSREELLERKARFMKLSSVERTEEIASLLPVDAELKRPSIERLRSQLEELPERPPLISVDALEDLGISLAQAQDIVRRVPGGANCAIRLEAIRETLRGMPPAECFAEISQFQQSMAGDLLSRLHALKGVADPQPPQLADLPASLVGRFVGQKGRHLLKIYGKGDIWNIDALGRFVREVRSVDPRATGNPLQAYEASQEMRESYELAALYALGVILVVLWIDFRSIRDCMLAILPLALGMVQTFGLMGWLDIPLNPANLIALPLILGIGVDYGVHIVHNFLEQPGRYRISPATAVAVMVDALTTILGFGSLMIASHQGLQSLGRVLTLGIACCTATSLWVLPAMLTWLSRNRVAGTAEAPLAAAHPAPADERSLNEQARLATADLQAADTARDLFSREAFVRDHAA